MKKILILLVLIMPFFVQAQTCTGIDSPNTLGIDNTDCATFVDNFHDIEYTWNGSSWDISETIYPVVSMIQTRQTTSNIYSSASALKIDLGTVDLSNNFSMTTNTITYNGITTAKYNVIYSATISSSIINEVEVVMYDNASPITPTARQQDNDSNKQIFTCSYIFDLSTTETIELYIKSNDQAGSADITVHNISLNITKI